MHKETFNDEKEYLTKLDNLLSGLCEKTEYINQLVREYEEVNITIYIRSDFAQLGYSLPGYIIKKLVLLDCDMYFDILSFGKVRDDEE